MPVPSETPEDRPTKWRKTHDGDKAKIWRNGTGDIITFTQSFNSVSDYWEITDTTDEVVNHRATGPFDTYLDALEYAHKFLPTLGTDELPDDVSNVADDAVASIESLPSGGIDRECAVCEESIFTTFRIEYGDGSHEWNCVKCAADRFNWSLDKDPTVSFDINDSGQDAANAIDAATESLLQHSNALLAADVVDENSLVSSLEILADTRFGQLRDNPEDLSPLPTLHRELHMHIVDYRDEHPDVSWGDVRDTLTDLRDFAHEYAREELGNRQGRRELLDEIQESDMTPNEWFEHNVERNDN